MEATVAKKHEIMSKKGVLKEVNLTPSKAIKAFCTACLGYETHPRDCTSRKCPLYVFRGKTQIAFD